jgi:hypothetical protein
VPLGSSVTFFSGPGRAASLICPDLTYDRLSHALTSSLCLVSMSEINKNEIVLIRMLTSEHSHPFMHNLRVQ